MQIINPGESTDEVITFCDPNQSSSSPPQQLSSSPKTYGTNISYENVSADSKQHSLSVRKLPPYQNVQLNKSTAKSTTSSDNTRTSNPTEPSTIASTQRLHEDSVNITEAQQP